MSKETLKWLNENTLIGFSEEYGKAWHHVDGDNHWDGPVPVDRVKKLFDWEAVRLPIMVVDEPEIDVVDDAVVFDDEPELVVFDTSRFMAICHPSNGTVFQIASNRYEIHQYREWLVDQVMALIDVSEGELTIGSAGLLANGGQAWVQVRPPKGLIVGGDEQVPWILATTSHDGSLATQYKGQRQRVVCDNTLSIGLGESTGEFRVRHTSNSRLLLAEARQALEMIYEQQDKFNEQVRRLLDTEFDNNQFMATIDELHPVPEKKMDSDRNVINERARNNVLNARAEVERMWFEDPRVHPWAGTAFGAWQAHNTWWHWDRTHGTGGDERLLKARQVKDTVNGDTEKWDRRVFDSITRQLVEV